MRSSSSEAETQRQRGSAVVELALLLPILLLVLLAVVQVGVVARDQLVLVQSARAGAYTLFCPNWNLRPLPL